MAFIAKDLVIKGGHNTFFASQVDGKTESFQLKIELKKDQIHLLIGDQVRIVDYLHLYKILGNEFL